MGLELGKNGNSLRGNMCSWVVLAVRKEEEARSKNLRESQKSDVLTSWCFLLKQMCCLDGQRLEKKTAQDLRPKEIWSWNVAQKQKKTTPTCEHIHILSTLKPPTKQEGIPQIYCTFALYDSPKVGNLVIPSLPVLVVAFLCCHVAGPFKGFRLGESFSDLVCAGEPMIGSIRESPTLLVVCERTGCSSERHRKTCISLGKQLVFAMFGRYFNHWNELHDSIWTGFGLQSSESFVEWVVHVANLFGPLLSDLRVTQQQEWHRSNTRQLQLETNAIQLKPSQRATCSGKRCHSPCLISHSGLSMIWVEMATQNRFLISPNFWGKNLHVTQVQNNRMF